jgi:hypothetical protein
MITPETTWEKISAWLPNEGCCAKGLGSLIMSCAIFASAAPLSKTSFDAKSSANGTNRCPAFESAGAAPPMSTDW